MLIFRPRLLLPLALAVGGCDFFTLDEPDDEGSGGSAATGGTGGSGGSGGVTGGSSGVGGATGGVGGAGGGSGAGAGGTAGDTSAGGMAGTAGSSVGGAGTGGKAGAAGDAAGMAGSGAAGADAGGASGDGGTSGTTGGAGAGGSGGGGPASCDAIQAQAYDGHCYLLNTGAATWSNARAACMSRSPGGHLVTITSQGEQDFVWGLAMQDVWIGATDGLADDAPGNGMPSMWITGEDIAQFNGWTSGEPNNYEKTCPSGSGTCYEHCGFLQMSSSGAWNDDICGFDKPYVCEWDTGG